MEKGEGKVEGFEGIIMWLVIFALAVLVLGKVLEIFFIYILPILLVVFIVRWIIRTIRESRVRELRNELEKSNAIGREAQVDSEEFVSGEPDSFEDNIVENMELSEQDPGESIDDETVSPVRKEVIKKPKHSRWELIKPDEKED